MYMYTKTNLGDKAVKLIRTLQTLNDTDVIKTLTCHIPNKGNIPMETFQLNNTVRNKLVRK